MHNKIIGSAAIAFTAVFMAAAALADEARAIKHAQPAENIAVEGPKIFWSDPEDITSRDLIFGQGGYQHYPGTKEFDFIREDLDGSQPKFRVKDSEGVKWKLKLGYEARPETVATRFVWAAGFRTDEDYLLPQIHITGLPANVHRGRKFIDPDGTTHVARLEREIEGEKKVGEWTWDEGPYTGTREWNGLRVMMALINNWDLKDINNSIYKVGKDKNGAEFVYLISDLGAAFGETRVSMGAIKHKGELKYFERSQFIRQSDAEFVDLATPGKPTPWLIVDPKEYMSRRHIARISRRVPVEDARWTGSILARLSPAQIRDAFRAAYYTPSEVEAFATIMEQRIAALNRL
jgi:hypothetical protein